MLFRTIFMAKCAQFMVTCVRSGIINGKSKAQEQFEAWSNKILMTSQKRKRERERERERTPISYS